MRKHVHVQCKKRVVKTLAFVHPLIALIFGRIMGNTSLKKTEKYIHSYLVIRNIETWMLYAEEQATKRAALSGVPSDEDDLDI